jgi:beta-barrel assembly-enhancing protease
MAMIRNITTSLIRRKVIVVVVLYAGILAACGVNLFTDKDDVQLGTQIDAEIRANPQEYPILQGHPGLKAEVRNIVNKILQSPEVKKRNVYPYKVDIIADDKTVNAFCTPGGYIYVYTGLIKFLDNEAALAGVLGHEIAHAERRHATKRITAAYGVQSVLALVLGENPGMVEQIAANLFTNLGFLKNSRDDEMESDNYSMKYLKSTEYYPGGITYFFAKIKTKSQSSPSDFEKLFLTHPPSDDRANNVSNKMREWNIPGPTESNLFTERYRRLVADLP